MTTYHYKNIRSTSQQFQEPMSANGICENQSTSTTICNNCMNVTEDINNNAINDYKASPSSDLNSSVNTQIYPLINDNSNEVSFNSQEWFIIDPVFRKLRPPRQLEFLLLLLENPNYSSYITWSDESQGLFIIHEPERVATLWGKVKNRRTVGHMDYATFARGLRFYYQSGLLIKTHKRHTFRFKIPVKSTS